MKLKWEEAEGHLYKDAVRLRWTQLTVRLPPVQIISVAPEKRAILHLHAELLVDMHLQAA